MGKFCYNCMKPIETDFAICPFCGNKPNCDVPVYHLRPGVTLNNRYTVGLAVGEGGFGITYVGKDNLLDMKVAIKEFYPSSIVTRVNASSMDIIVASEPIKVNFFNMEKEHFLAEARTLAKFSGDAGTVNVIDFFEANNTAYIAMEFIDGITLAEYLKKRGTITYKETIELMMPIMESLAKIHKTGILHGDISPDNIMMSNGKTKLLDFGASENYRIKVQTHSSIKLKHGYAPEEQYREKGNRGPWSDIYSLCATMYKCITGRKPDNACDRLVDDRVTSPSGLGVLIDSYVEAALMKGLSIRQEDRFQIMEELIAALNNNFTADYDDDKTVVLRTQDYSNEEINPFFTQQPDFPTYNTQYPDAAANVPVYNTIIPEQPAAKKTNILKILIPVLCVILLVAGGITAAVVIRGNLEKNEIETVCVSDETQKVYVEEATIPERVIKGTPFKIRGIIKTNKTKITNVYGCITDMKGNVIQDSSHDMNTDTHDLRKSINNYLIFGNLSVGEYIYRVNVTIEKGNSKATKTLIECKFEVIRG